MRVGPHPLLARPEWYDRNPVDASQLTWLVDMIPHTLTVRWSYTVPAGKKAWLECLSAYVKRKTAPTTPGTAMARVDFLPGGTNATPILICEIFTGTVNDRDRVIMPTSIMLKAGDIIRASTLDSSAGGTVDYLILAKITQFDA